MTIEDFLRLLLRNLFLLIVVTVIGAAAGYGSSFTRPEVYAASALGYVSANPQLDEAGNPVQQAGASLELQYSKAQSYMPLFGTRAVGQTIVDELGLQSSADQVAGSLSVVLDPNAPILTVTARAGSAQEASAIANAAVEATAAEARSLETGGDPDVPLGVQLVPYQTAVVPGAPVSPDRMRYLAVGAAAGLLLALAIAWLRDRNDSRIRTAEDLAAIVDLPLLATLPDDKGLQRAKDGALADPTNFAAREALRRLRTNLRFVDVDEPPRSIVVTSGAPGEGKSMVAANLARVMARAGQPTLLIDADLRRPMVADEFGVDGSVGLSQLLAAAVSIEDAAQPSSVPLLTLLAAGQVPPNPSELLGSRRMKELIAELSRHHFVIIDAPPVLAVTDAQLLARHADGAILVAVSGQTRSLGLTRSIAAIRDIGGKVYGIVLNRSSSSRLNRLAYGDDGYGAYSSYGEEFVPDSESVLPDSAGGDQAAIAGDVTDEGDALAPDPREPATTAPARRTAHDASAATTPGGSRPAAASRWPASAEAPRRPRGRRVAPADQDPE